jgi:hypothetical protein
MITAIPRSDRRLPDYRGVFVEDGGYFFTNLGIDDDAWFTFLAAARRDKYAYVDAYLCDYLGGAQGGQARVIPNGNSGQASIQIRQ